MNRFADSHIHYRFLQFDKIEAMLELMHSIGVTDACLLSLPYRGAAENLCGLYWKMKYQKMKVRTFGGPHITDRYCQIPYELQAEKLLDLGCDGIKIMNDPDLRRYVGCGPNDKKFEKMFELLQERGTPINMHVNNPRFFWDNGMVGADFISFDKAHKEVLEMLDKFPKLNITFAHFMFLSDDPDEATRIMDKYPNVRFDLTPGGEMFVNFSKNPSYWHDFFTEYSTRILFGTDSNSIKSINEGLNRMVYNALTNSHDEYVQPNIYGRDWHLRGLALGNETVNRICYHNFIDFVGEPKPVNEELFYECCQRVLDDIKTKPCDEFYIAGGELINDLKNDPNQTVSTAFLEKVLGERNV
ncbi:MAG: amidohydrolase family protein [Clostridia bacterium]|nr:amidohydrolase family protein [Clostridia bacterium]